MMLGTNPVGYILLRVKRAYALMYLLILVNCSNSTAASGDQ
jgi:hypothetical protein